jgi:NAD(P)H-hydrate repair Nnr-like enzyme with NAD(P)H-hydrate dehydratase domain
MADFDYWRRQGAEKLFPEVDTMRPEQRRFAGKLLLIGGNKGMFFTVANAMQEAGKIGVGECRAVMPDSLKNMVPSTPDIYFAESEVSGAFGQKSLPEMLRQAEWADAIILVGDLGKNGETSIVMAEFLNRVDKPIYLTRDAIDAVTADATNWSMRDARTILLASLPQLQKLLRSLYYPKVITLSMPTNQLVETLHKFTLTYEMTIVTFHNEQLIVAQNGEIISMGIKDTGYAPISLFNGSLIVKMATLGIWNLEKTDLKTVTSALMMK